MPRYRITTLVDITRTKALKTDPDQLRIFQQNNFDSLRQAIELRSNVTWIKDPERREGRLPNGLDGKSNYWYWEFDVELEDLFSKDGDKTALLKDDLNFVPIITGLNETAKIEPAAFQTLGDNVNTVVDIM